MSYRWDASVLTEAYRWHRRLSRAKAARLLLALAALALVYYQFAVRPLGASQAAYPWGWIAAVVVFYGLLIFGVRRFYVPWVMRRNLAKSPLHHSQMSWRISESLLRYQFAHGQSELGWGAFLKVVQTPKGILLYPQPLQFHWLPKANFACEADFEQVAKWAYGNVPNFRHLG